MKSQNLSQFSNFRILLLITTVSIYFIGFNFKEYVPEGVLQISIVSFGKI